MAKAPAKDKTGLLLDIRNLRIEATSYPPGEAPRNVVGQRQTSLDDRVPLLEVFR